MAERLRLQYVDQDILVAAARALGVPAESVASLDQRAAGLAERLASALPRLRSAAASPPGAALDAVLGRTYSEVAGNETGLDAIVSALRSEQPDLRPHAALDGTVTVLFTDIEGSTALNERLGDPAWLAVLHRHNEIVREQVQAHGGFEVKSQGDSFMLAFGSARRALQCAIDIQRSFAAYSQQADESIRVRMGLHTGEVVREADDFYGRNVNLASRIANEAHGGEILVSSLVRELTHGSGDFRFGEGQELELKGVSGKQRVCSVAWRAANVSDEEYISVIRGLFHELAVHDDVLLLGRGSQVILKDWPGVFHVLLIAPVEQRIAVIVGQEGVGKEEATQRVRETDKARAAFHRKFFGVAVDQPALYHLVLNMGRIQVEEAVRAIVGLAQGVAAGR